LQRSATWLGYLIVFVSVPVATFVPLSARSGLDSQLYQPQEVGIWLFLTRCCHLLLKDSALHDLGTLFRRASLML
jgi:hypothetical protein